MEWGWRTVDPLERKFEVQTRPPTTSRFIHPISSDTYRDSITQEDAAGISEPTGLRSAPIATQSETPTTTHSARPATLCLLIRCFRAAERLIMSKGESVGREREGKGWLASEEKGGGEKRWMSSPSSWRFVRTAHPLFKQSPGDRRNEYRHHPKVSNLRQLEEEKVGNEFAV